MLLRRAQRGASGSASPGERSASCRARWASSPARLRPHPSSRAASSALTPPFAPFETALSLALCPHHIGPCRPRASRQAELGGLRLRPWRAPIGYGALGASARQACVALRRVSTSRDTDAEVTALQLTQPRAGLDCSDSLLVRRRIPRSARGDRARA
jgi:hypothetical protein